jgi:hypothetical protein
MPGRPWLAAAMGGRGPHGKLAHEPMINVMEYRFVKD